jgi:murein DD-endopeptidase MepM/ murein hydrolase activator NlpD
MIRTLLLCAVLAMAAALPSAAAGTVDLELVFPQEATVTEFTSSFGAPRGERRHLGNDLMAPKMTEVYAAADGTVTWIREQGSAGRYVVIAHGDGWETWYMHLNNDTPGTDDGRAPMSMGVAVAEGDEVEAGDLIGWVGDSGNAEWSSPHTHFELHRNGRPVDPYPYLVTAYQRAIERGPLPIGSYRPR